MRLVVFGAAGRTGRVVVALGLDRGHEVTAFVRRPDAFDPVPSGLHVEVGDALDGAAVEGVAAGHQAAISVLGVAEDAPPTALSDATASVVRALERSGPQRLVVLMTVGVLLTKVSPEFAQVTEEHRRNLEVLRASSLDWVGVVAPGITDDAPTGTVHMEVEQRGPNWEIARGDLAAALLDEAVEPAHLRTAVGVSN